MSANMAEGDVKDHPAMPQDKEQKLKYLDFVQVATLYVIACLSAVYDFAKENSGPLKPGVQTVEGTVKTVIGPVYEKFHDVPFELLKYVDRKITCLQVDDTVSEVDRHVPSLVKNLSSQAMLIAQQAPEVARAVASEVQRVGVVETVAEIAQSLYTKCEPTAKELYNKYEPVAEHYAVVGWRSLNQLPLFPQVAHIMVPTAAYWAEKYNKTVIFMAERGYGLSSYLPLVPIERIAKVFGEEESKPGPNDSTGAEAAAKQQ